MPTAKPSTETQDFKTAFLTLKNNAQTLQNSQEPDIDALMDVVTDSISAYKICQSRIVAVQSALDEAFSEAWFFKSHLAHIKS